jgi:hypothetical protein
MLDLSLRHSNARQMRDAADGIGVDGHKVFLGPLKKSRRV